MTSGDKLSFPKLHLWWHLASWRRWRPNHICFLAPLHLLGIETILMEDRLRLLKNEVAKPAIYTLPSNSMGVQRIIYKTCHF